MRVDSRVYSRRHHAEAIQILLIFGAIILLLALILAYFAWKAHSSWSLGSERMQFGVIALGALLIGGGMLLQARHLYYRILPLFRWIEETPQLIVWVYSETHSYQTAGLGGGFGRTRRSMTTVGVGLEDGRLETLIAETEEAGRTLADSISALAPLATRGYSPELVQRFQTSPSTFRNAPPAQPLSAHALLESIRDHGATVIVETLFGEEEIHFLRDGSSGQYLVRTVDLVCSAPTREDRIDEGTLALELGRIQGPVKLKLPGGRSPVTL